MVRLVGQFRKDLLTDTHRDVAAKLESEGSRREAEKHYVEANDWKRAVDMYRAAGQWEDALRVAKGHGGAAAGRAVAFAWAQSLDRDAGIALLSKMGLLEAAIDFAADSGKFDYAFDLANGAKHKMPEVYLKRAMHYEDQGSFEEAEREFLAAGKPREAIDMWLHCGQARCGGGWGRVALMGWESGRRGSSFLLAVTSSQQASSESATGSASLSAPASLHRPARGASQRNN